MALLTHYNHLHSASTAEGYAKVLPDLTKFELEAEIEHVEVQLDAYSYLVEKQKERKSPNLDEDIRVVRTLETKQRLLQEEQARRSED